MGKEKKKRSEWVIFFQGSMVALWLYACGLFLSALFLVKGILPEDTVFPVIAGICLTASLLGGLFVSGKSTWGSLPAAVLNAGIFSGILALVGMMCWNGIVWQGNGGVLIVCALTGGLLAALFAKPQKGRKRVKNRRLK